MDELLKYWKEHFYTEVVSYILAIVGFFISLRRNKLYPKLKPLSFFFLAYFLDVSFIYGIVATVSDPHLIDWGVGLADFIDTIIEFLVFVFVIKNHTVSIRISKALKSLLFLFPGIAIVYFLYYIMKNDRPNQFFLQNIFTIQASFLIVASVLYYVDVFKKEPKSNLISEPSFWVVTGLAFFMLSTLPFSILGLYLIKINYVLYSHLFSIFEVFYWILFLMIIKAYFCKPEQA
jgi:hypothetical protein